MATISVICYKSKTLSNGEYPLVIRITKDGNRSYKYLGISVEAQHWDFKKNEPKPNCPNRDHILKIIQDKKAEYQTQVLEFKTSHKNFTASSLIKTTEQTTVSKTVDTFYRELIAHYRKLGKIGNSNIYRDSYNSIGKSGGRCPLAPGKIDPFRQNKVAPSCQNKNVPCRKVNQQGIFM